MTLLTTNNCLNPSFEVNVTDDWGFYQGGAGGSANLDATQYKVGAKSCRIRAGNALAMIGLSGAGVSVPNGATVTVSGWMRCSADPTGNKAMLYLYSTWQTAAVYATVASNGAWEYRTVSKTNTSGGAVTFRVEGYNYFNDSAADVWFDACQLELAAAATTYTDGSLGGQCAWTGTAHNSTSTRTLATQALAGAQTNTGTVTKKTLKTLAGTMTNTGIVAAVKGLGLLLIARLRDYFLRAEQADHDLTAEFRDYTLTAPQREKHA